jgi:hypothetical protein
MRNYVFATAILVAFATPAVAAQFYVGRDASTNECHVMAQKPDGTTMQMVGSGAYKSATDAQRAIQSLSECGN